MKDIITVIIITFLFLWLGIAHATEVKVLVDDAVVYQFNCETPPPPSSCGDRICNAGETCSTCPQDCGTCPPPVDSTDIGKDFYTVYPNLRTDSIRPNAIRYYYFKLAKATSNVIVILQSKDWVTDQDFIVSKTYQPTLEVYNEVRSQNISRNPSATYWFTFGQGTMEKVTLSGVGGIAGDIF